ncbi:MAG: pyruvate formate lyase family protein [Prolixibacteraceae bacterium]
MKIIESQTKLVPELPQSMTPRTAQLRKSLCEHAKTNRKDDWLDKSKFPTLNKPKRKEQVEPVIIRRARGIATVLEALTDPKQEKCVKTSYKIDPGELLVGVLPMGSNGLGKVFPDYLTEEERQMASLANRSEFSIQGHNSADYNRLVNFGMTGILKDCRKSIKKIGRKRLAGGFTEQDQSKIDFYNAVIICCEAVVAYAGKYADLAERMAETETDSKRRDELGEIARICRKVPMQPAETFHEALQSVLFLQIGFRAGMDLLSLGRLDQTLQPFLVRNGKPDQEELARAVELTECLVIKLSEPMNLTVDHLTDQDHVDFGVTMGTSRWYADQRGNVNQFLQNVVIGGKNADGSDATVESTYVLLQAWTNVNLPTPGLYVRLHRNSPEKLLGQVAASIAATGNLPSVLNDEMVIPGFIKSLTDDRTIREKKARELVFDYCVDGCWEPILNGQGDWTFNMINGLTVLECTLNEGATLDNNPMQLRGGKRSWRTPPVTNYQELMDAMKTNMDFILFQSAGAMYNYYLLDEYVTPAPLLSAFLGSCLERGQDKTCGGCRYAVAGTILSGLPNLVNSIAAINKWVFENKKYPLSAVVDAFRTNFGIKPGDPNKIPGESYREIYYDLRDNSPRYGTNNPVADRIAREIVDCFILELAEAKRLADKAYREKAATKVDPEECKRLRMAGGYYGEPLIQKNKKNTIAFTGGLGTFASFTLMGSGVAASADRLKDEPLTKNNTTSKGTNNRSFAHIFASLKTLDLSRFPGGAPVDLTLDLQNESSDGKTEVIRAVIESFMKNDGQVMSITLGSSDLYKKIHEIAKKAESGSEQAVGELLKYADVIVRAGGWQSPFITLSIDQQSHYIDAAISL